MNSQQRRISRFWMEGGHLTDPPLDAPDPPAPPDHPDAPTLYRYGLEDGVVYRFRSPMDRQEWLMDAPDTREAIRASHPLARKFRQAPDVWRDDMEGTQ